LLLIQRDQLREDQLRHAIVKAKLDLRRIERVYITGVRAISKWVEDLLPVREFGIRRRLGKRPGQPTTAEQDSQQGDRGASEDRAVA
jgi:hypothetical protein